MEKIMKKLINNVCEYVYKMVLDLWSINYKSSHILNQEQMKTLSK